MSEIVDAPQELSKATIAKHRRLCSDIQFGMHPRQPFKSIIIEKQADGGIRILTDKSSIGGDAPNVDRAMNELLREIREFVGR